MAGGLLVTSCSMNELPEGTLNDETAISTEQDAMNFRNGIYVNLRSITNGSYIAYTEMQTDMFVGTVTNGNRLGMMSLGTFLASDTDLEPLWANTYSDIAAVNYFLPKVDGMIEGAEGDSKVRLQRYRGEAKFARAYYYYFLADKYCNSYTVIDPTTPASGVPLVTTYNPSGDYASYPGRSTLAEVFTQIEKDLNDAYADLSAFESSSLSDAKSQLAPNASYLSTYAVTALQARIALLKGDWATAITKAEQVIGTNGSSPFELCDDLSYETMWTNDEGSELIFVPFGNQTQSGAVAALGEAWIMADGISADYVCTQNALDLYPTLDDDVRYYTFIQDRSLNIEGRDVVSPCFIKYPGNPALNTGSVNAMKNNSKPFRLSEMYLIVAEAAAEAGQTQKANDALNAIRTARIYGYQAQQYVGANLISEVRLERMRELIGEGHRISDLRRWRQGFQRSVAYTNPVYGDVPAALVSAGKSVSYTVGDYRYLLPIPTGEMETSPQLAGQQNPGF